MSFKSIRSYSNRFLIQNFRQLEQQKLGIQRIRHVLPASIAKHALHCVFNEKKLTLYTDSAAWGSQLRFYKSAILAAAATMNGPSANILQIRILTGKTGLNVKEDKKASVPSAENIAMIQSQSDHVSDDELKLALQKLCATLSKR